MPVPLWAPATLTSIISQDTNVRARSIWSGSYVLRRGQIDSYPLMLSCYICPTQDQYPVAAKRAALCSPGNAQYLKPWPSPEGVQDSGCDCPLTSTKWMCQYFAPLLSLSLSLFLPLFVYFPVCLFPPCAPVLHELPPPFHHSLTLIT